MSARLIIFDCDGTLVDSQHLIHAAMSGAFTGRGLEAPTVAAVRAIVGLSLTEAMTRLAPPAYGRDRTAIAGLVDGYRDAFTVLRADPAHEEPMYDGARAALDRLHAEPDTLLAIATGKSRRGVRHLVEREGLHGYFTTVQTADDAPSKPHPGMIEQAMAHTGADARETVMIGDTTFDIEMAVNAGVAALGVNWGYHPPARLVEAGAQRVLGHFDELDQALDALLTGPVAVK